MSEGGLERRGRRGADGVLMGFLVAGASHTEAAQAAGVSERTVRRRLRDPDFSAEVERLRSETVRAVASALRSAALGAVSILVELQDVSSPPGGSPRSCPSNSGESGPVPEGGGVRRADS